MAEKKRRVVKTESAKLQFHYIKGPIYREITCHGAIGGVTSQRLITMSVYAERNPIPRLVEYEVRKPVGSNQVTFSEAQATPGHVETRHGVIRHIETTLYMDIEVAKRIHKWLGERIDEASPSRSTK